MEGNTLPVKEMVQADLEEAKKGDLCITGVLVHCEERQKHQRPPS